MRVYENMRVGRPERSFNQDISKCTKNMKIKINLNILYWCRYGNTVIWYSPAVQLKFCKILCYMFMSLSLYIYSYMHIKGGTSLNSKWIHLDSSFGLSTYIDLQFYPIAYNIISVTFLIPQNKFVLYMISINSLYKCIGKCTKKIMIDRNWQGFNKWYETYHHDIILSPIWRSHLMCSVQSILLWVHLCGWNWWNTSGPLRHLHH